MEQVRELNMDEMSKVSGGAGDSTECLQHNWHCYGESTYGEIWKCANCGKTEYRGGSGYGNTPVPMPMPSPNPDPKPIPLD